MSAASWTVVAGAAAVTFAIKAAGPAALGGRSLPPAVGRMIGLLAPALLAALIATNALADGGRLVVGADTAGVIAATAVVWRTRSVVACVLVAAVVTAALRALGA